MNRTFSKILNLILWPWSHPFSEYIETSPSECWYYSISNPQRRSTTNLLHPGWWQYTFVAWMPLGTTKLVLVSCRQLVYPAYGLGGGHKWVQDWLVACRLLEIDFSIFAIILTRLVTAPCRPNFCGLVVDMDVVFSPHSHRHLPSEAPLKKLEENF